MGLESNNHSFWGNVMSYAGWGIGLASLIITVYAEFIKKEAPKLEYEIISSTDFIKNQETSANLRIFVDTLDVQENHLNITAYNIKVENKGTEHIRYDDYDKGNFGLKVIDGILLEPPTLLQSSTSHIKELYAADNDSLKDERFLCIPSLSLDVEDNYTIRVVLLHSADKAPRFLPEGKIVGQKSIEFHELQPQTPRFWEIVFSGKWYIHISRFFIYVFIIALCGFVVAFISSKTSDFFNQRKRMKQMKKLTNKNILDFVKEDYIEKGEEIISEMYSVYEKNETEISSHYKKSKSFVNSERANRANPSERWFHQNRYRRIQRMIDRGYLSLKGDNQIGFNKEAKKSVQAIYTILDLKKYDSTPIYVDSPHLIGIV